MNRNVVTQSSAFTLRTKYYGESGAPQSPSTVRYLIKDVTNDRIVRDWTTLTPSSVLDIQIVSSENALLNNYCGVNYDYEERVVSVQANFDTDAQYTDEYRYLIENQRGF